jgi:hypothetical protein
MKRVRILIFVLVVAFVCATATFGLAASTTDGATASVTIQAAATLTVTETTISFGTKAGFTSGVQTPTENAPGGYLNARARCNAKLGYMLSVQAADFVDGSESIAATTLSFCAVDDGDPIGTLAALAAADTDLDLYAANEPRTTGVGKDYDIYARLTLAGDEPEGSYTSAVTFTLTY